jgi:hypothetical protein
MYKMDEEEKNTIDFRLLTLTHTDIYQKGKKMLFMDDAIFNLMPFQLYM